MSFGSTLALVFQAARDLGAWLWSQLPFTLEALLADSGEQAVSGGEGHCGSIVCEDSNGHFCSKLLQHRTRGIPLFPRDQALLGSNCSLLDDSALLETSVFCSLHFPLGQTEEKPPGHHGDLGRRCKTFLSEHCHPMK